MEGEENTPESPLDESNSSSGHSEFELTFVLIMIGLLGIAFFAWYVGSGAGLREKIETYVVSDVVITNEEMTSENFTDVEGRDENILGLAIHKDEGRYYTHSESGMALYTNTVEECDERCEEYFVPYMTEGKHQSIPDGGLLYLYINDVFPGDITGKDFDTIWHIARP